MLLPKTHCVVDHGYVYAHNLTFVHKETYQAPEMTRKLPAFSNALIPLCS